MSNPPAITTQGSQPPRHYEILVRGPVGPTLLQAFGPLTAHRRGQNTLLSGPLPDQSALYGVLHQLEALGMELLEVRCSAPIQLRPQSH
jgi:epsilon-lactone hydrolase